MTGRRVAVTGMGVLCATATDLAGFADAIFAGRCGIGPLEGLPNERLTVRTAAQLRNFDPADHLDRRRAPQLDRVSLLAVVAAREAWAQSAPDPDPVRAGAVLGGSIGLETYDAAAKQLYGENARRLPPLTVPRIMPNAQASAVTMELGLRGPAFSVASACASSTHAIGLAAGLVRAGAADVMVTGGADNPFAFGNVKAWDALRVLSPDLCRPFSLDRAGLVLGEGAGILVLESWDRARARGAAILGEVLGFGMTADAGDLLAPGRDGARRAMEGALADAGLPPDAVDHVNAHGTGTKLNDSTEAAALADLLGRRVARVPVTGTKGGTGHCLNASGALEAIGTLLALGRGLVPPTAGFTTPDPDCPVDIVTNEPRRVDMAVAISNSFAFGGLNASLALGRAA